VQGVILSGLSRVVERFDAQLRSDLPPVDRLVGHVERYRGKMLRPTLVLACGLASHPRIGGTSDDRLHELISPAHATAGAVCEMVHMATLVHDDVLDEADTRRRGRTVNRLHGNETAVILGDLLIAGSYELCAQLDTIESARLIGRVSMEMCQGELLQLHHRGDFSLDEATYFEIVGRKTAALIGACCELGAMHSGATPAVRDALGAFGRDIGIAFQIQDDLLDLSGDERVVGKSVGKDIEKAKLTLPMIHHLACVGVDGRGRSLRTLESACSESDESAGAVAELRTLLVSTGSIDAARERARSLVASAIGRLEVVPASGARRVLVLMGEAVVERSA
jgi:octaprenyl-diphosphate synthase